MIARLSRSAAKSAATAAVLLGLGLATATAQTTAPATENHAVPAAQADQATPAAQAPSLKADAIRVPAMGGGASQPGATGAEAAATDKPIKTASKPKKRARVVYREIEDEDEVVYMGPRYAPHFHYAPRPAYRYGYGLGPGFGYAW